VARYDVLLEIEVALGGVVADVAKEVALFLVVVANVSIQFWRRDKPAGAGGALISSAFVSHFVLWELDFAREGFTTNGADHLICSDVSLEVDWNR
jgi:hypothetical protein